MKIASGRIDWARVTQVLSADHGIRPWEVKQLTLSEISCLLEKHEAQGSRPEDVDAYAARNRAMTPLERLEALREGRL